MRRAPILLCTALVAACGGGPTGPTGPAMPAGTILATAPTTDLWLIDAATGDTTRLTQRPNLFNLFSTTLGPGGAQVSGFQARPTRALRLVDLKTMELTEILPLDESIITIGSRISPDGRLLAFGSLGWVAPGEYGIATIDLQTGATQERWRAPDDDPELGLADLHWLPDQSGIIAMAEQGVGPKWVVRLDFATGALTNITEPALVSHIGSLDLAPDGRLVAYALEGDLIRFVRLDGTPAAGYPTHLRGNFPTFSPDGRLLAFSRYREGSLDIDGIWFYRFSDGAMWRALPEAHLVTWVRDWE